MATVRKCYYELLQVESTANASEIKTQYYKLARQYHPDKNIGNEDEAEIIFKELQAAYEVLSNPQERAWYDSHKDQILRGGTEKDVSGLNLWPYFSRSCFSGFGEKQNNFYAVYETAFASIAAEEVKMGYSKDDIPDFGNANSDYGHVRKFYNYWINFATRKNFSWADIYKTTEAPNRLYRRLAEKENDKERKKAVREFNEIVRRLASFVKRQDPRVLKELEKQKNEKKEKEVIAQKELANVHEYRKQAREEAHRAWLEETNEEDDIPIDEEDLSKSEEVVVQLYRCDVCKKTFKNENQYKNHERSKKHKTNMQKFKKEISFDSNIESELEKNKDTIHVAKEPEPVETKNTEEPINHNENENNVDNETNNTNEHSNSDDNNEVGEVDETWAALLHQFDGENLDDSEQEHLSRMLKNEQSKDQKKKQKKQKPKQHEVILKEKEEMVKKVFEKYEKVEKKINESSEVSPINDSTEQELGNEEIINEDVEEKEDKVTEEDTPKKKRRRRKEKTGDDKQSKTQAISCGKCGRKFNTRNQLFVHIKSTGHALVK